MGCRTHLVAIFCNCSRSSLRLAHRPDGFCRGMKTIFATRMLREADLVCDPGMFAHQVETRTEKLYPLHLHPKRKLLAPFPKSTEPCQHTHKGTQVLRQFP